MKERSVKKIINILKDLGNLEELEKDVYLFRWGGKEVDGLDERFNIKDFPCIVTFDESEELQLNVFVFLDEENDKDRIAEVVNEINAQSNVVKAYIDDDNDVTMVATVGAEKIEEKESILEIIIVVLILGFIKIKAEVLEDSDEEK